MTSPEISSSPVSDTPSLDTSVTDRRNFCKGAGAFLGFLGLLGGSYALVRNSSTKAWAQATDAVITESEQFGNLVYKWKTDEADTYVGIWNSDKLTVRTLGQHLVDAQKFAAFLTLHRETSAAIFSLFTTAHARDAEFRILVEVNRAGTTSSSEFSKAPRLLPEVATLLEVEREQYKPSAAVQAQCEELVRYRISEIAKTDAQAALQAIVPLSMSSRLYEHLDSVNSTSVLQPAVVKRSQVPDPMLVLRAEILRLAQESSFTDEEAALAVSTYRTALNYEVSVRTAIVTDNLLNLKRKNQIWIVLPTFNLTASGAKPLDQVVASEAQSIEGRLREHPNLQVNVWDRNGLSDRFKSPEYIGRQIPAFRLTTNAIRDMVEMVKEKGIKDPENHWGVPESINNKARV